MEHGYWFAICVSPPGTDPMFACLPDGRLLVTNRRSTVEALVAYMYDAGVPCEWWALSADQIAQLLIDNGLLDDELRRGVLVLETETTSPRDLHEWVAEVAADLAQRLLAERARLTSDEISRLDEP